MTLAQVIPPLIIGIGFILLYLWDKDKKESNIMLRTFFLGFAVSFFYIALLNNSIVVQAYTVQSTGTPTTFTTNYIYNNTVIYISSNFSTISISGSFVLYTIIYVLLISLILIRGWLDIGQQIGEHI